MRIFSHKIFQHFTFYVLIAIIAGVALGHFNPAYGLKLEFIGTYFISIIKLFIPPIIFFTIVLGISYMGDLKKVGRVGIKALIYFEIITTFSLAIGIGVAMLLKPGNIDRTKIPLGDVSKFTNQGKTPFSWLHFLESNITIQILLIAIFVGILLNFYPRKEPIVSLFGKLSKFVFALLKYIMYLAPVAAFGAMAFTVSKFGLATLVPLAKLLICVYITMAIFIFVVLGMVMKYYGLNVFKFLNYIKEEILIVLGTSSSETALPNIIRKLENAGSGKSIVGLVIPVGYSFNLDGTSIYLSMATIFLAQLYNVPLSFEEILLILGILMITSKGAAGVTGSGFVVLASTLTSLDVIPIEGLGFLWGVDKFMSEGRSITNLIGNAIATLVIAKSEKEFDEKLYHEVVK
ncbi:MAG: cation:dicarboxylase symporter family transporter [Bacteroidia bacterium]|nr:cation:dicarboxylase symporter family transporter [Bacteroidia bacterium]MCF8427676.1 cation:dicarboxylase symporter family transporter [Bacteroidia bacterium]MCF8447086.1 cation:dicarboxylase symporter family transporter [Bacteroidia bacterium]